MGKRWDRRVQRENETMGSLFGPPETPTSGVQRERARAVADKIELRRLAALLYRSGQIGSDPDKGWTISQLSEASQKMPSECIRLLSLGDYRFTFDRTVYLISRRRVHHSETGQVAFVYTVIKLGT